jgi:hypothetical protein
MSDEAELPLRLYCKRERSHAVRIATMMETKLLGKLYEIGRLLEGLSQACG